MVVVAVVTTQSGHNKHLEECAKEGHQSRLGDAVPELEFREPPHEGTKLLINLGGQPRPIINCGGKTVCQ